MKLLGPSAAAYLARKLAQGGSSAQRTIGPRAPYELDQRVAWGSLTGARQETGDLLPLADIYRGHGAGKVTIATAEPVRLHNEPADWEPTEGETVVLLRFRAAWEGVLTDAGFPDPPSTGFYVLGAVDGAIDWAETIQIDYGT
jgi:hypothetical protein